MAGTPGAAGRSDPTTTAERNTVRLLADGVLDPQIAARIPLAEAASALALAESRTVAGKVILVP
ncbi:zinc-binding dehydrogenase [Micromonospora sp. WMMD1120]|uniref:zinc-binding dehydrogenase n=1 Tax=Micromonospora sp. WMMD1120 TaxID=3016106 RepID=UPI002416A151|nr:zinc-binding dehydrogenase [Micromonospora sp. WMMD1120]MDG4809506.1 zinc-binding dehydrogenase [Micromonospora sp. WMMD1120]